ncbi:ATPase domain-containing protein [Selenomonas sp. AE3005]|uniref:ATPase domain-containing protein n=1 Tax=Selenomonas sp. AE3005 TaxID=1485543 RepID=UPI000689C831|nr:ATPase domain-containing protein [Selenomonas sp. AE3005]
MKSNENKRASFEELVKEIPELSIKSSKGSKPLPRMSTGIIELDRILDGGLPIGRFVEFFGDKDCGKVEIAYQCIAAAQARGKKCAYIDAAQGIGKRCNLINVEHTFDPFNAEKIGVDRDNLDVRTPPDGEIAFKMVEELINSYIDLIVIDSVEALVPIEALNSRDYETLNTKRAQLMNWALKKLVGRAKATGCTIIFINRNRKTGYVNDHDSIGGNGFKSYLSVRIEVNKTKKNGVDYIKALTVKNDTFSPFKKAEFELSELEV